MISLLLLALTSDKILASWHSDFSCAHSQCDFHPCVDAVCAIWQATTAVALIEMPSALLVS